MTIIREIDGKTVRVELDWRELREAFYEQQAIFDCADMKNFITSRYEDYPESFKDAYGVELSEALKDDSLQSMAAHMRRNIDRYDVSWEYAVEMALTDWVSDFNSILNSIINRKEGINQ